MDLVTQAILGAGVGHVVAGRKLGAKAMAIGALGGLIPDADIIPFAAWNWLSGKGAAISSHGIDYWQHHRGLSHSLFFGPVVAVPLAALSRWVSESRRALDTHNLDQPISFWLYYLLWMATLITHPMLDAITHWGTMLLAPVSDVRYGISALPIIDIAYTTILVIGLIYAVRKGARSVHARNGMIFTLALSVVWIAYGWLQNKKAVHVARQQLEQTGRPVSDVHAYTTLLTPWLRRVVAKSDDAWKVGYVSTWSPQKIKWTDASSAPEAKQAMQQFKTTQWGRIFFNFANGPVRAKFATSDNGTRQLKLYDMRYGVPGASFDGFWGLIVPVKPDLKRAELSSFLNRPRINDRQFQAFWKATFGRPQNIY